MKILSYVFTVVLFFSLLACSTNENKESDNLNWNTNLEESITLAKKENKKVFVYFTGSDWCKWCFKLNDEVISKKEFEKYANENLILVKLDFPRNIEQSMEVKQYNSNLMQRFQVRGFPTILLFDGNGNKIGTTGYAEGGAVKYVNHLKNFIKG